MIDVLIAFAIGQIIGVILLVVVTACFFWRFWRIL